jgi:iron complex transport system substrate-binding protein
LEVHPLPRIVSLIASATETVCALGAGDGLVGRSHECDFPSWVQHLPVCTAPRIATDGSSATIDRDVKAAVADGLSVYQVDAELLHSLQPQVIVTQSHCEVCAVSEHDVTQALDHWPDNKPQIVSLKPNCLADVWASIQQVADAIALGGQGRQLTSDLQTRVQRIDETAETLAGPRVACIEWLDPLMAAGNWVPELVDLAGGIDLFGTAGQHAPWLTWDELREADPDLIILMPCGFDIARTRQEMPALTSRPGWSDLQAVGRRQVVLTDGNQFFNRPGPRLVESLEILAELLHPQVFHFDHEGSGWQRL